MSTSMSAVLFKTALLICIIGASWCRFLTSSEESYQHPSSTVSRTIRSRPVLYSDLSGIDPSAYIVRQNDDERRSRLYIGKRPRVEPAPQQLQRDGLSDDVNSEPWLNMMLEKEAAEEAERHHGAKESSVYDVQRRSIREAVDAVSGERHRFLTRVA